MSLNNKELEHIEVLTEVKNKHLKQSKGAQKLNLSIRQFKRLLRRFRAEGPQGVISKKVGAPSNHQLSQKEKTQILDFFKEENHRDFGPTLAQEYLEESKLVNVSVSAVRTVMIKNGLWIPNKVRELKIHPLRARLGELIQLDGSEHDWFEGRGLRCTLLTCAN